MADFKTQTGRRPDLEQIEVNPVIGYIGDMIYPTVNTAIKSSIYRYKTLTADAAAQTGRTPGVAPTRTLLTDSQTTFTAAEVIKGYGITKSEVQQTGGIEGADRLGGMASKRSVQRAIEDMQIEQLMTGTMTDIGSAIIAGLETAASSVRRYTGDLALVIPESAYLWMIKQTEITGKLSWTFNVDNLEAADTISVRSKMFLAFLQSIMSFKQVLIFDDDSRVTGDLDAAAVVKLPPAEEFSHKLDPVLGKTMLYLPDGEQQFEIESHYDEDDKVNKYDCTSWLDIVEGNAGAKALVDGLGATS